MGFFDSWSDIVAAATPWSQVEAEAVSGGSSTEKTPANKDDGGEGEAKESTKDKKDGDDEEGGDDEESKDDEPEEGEEKEDEEEEEEDEEEMVDPKEKFEEECKESKKCSPHKHHFDECVERVTGADEGKAVDKKHPNEDCVEEFFHLAHCATQCAAPKLWAALK